MARGVPPLRSAPLARPGGVVSEHHLSVTGRDQQLHVGKVSECATCTDHIHNDRADKMQEIEKARRVREWFAGLAKDPEKKVTR